MNTEEWGNILAFACAPAASLFWLLYATTAPWWRSWTGRAIVTSKLGLAVLVDAAVLFRLHHKQPFAYQQQLLLIAFALITVGTWLYLFALWHEQYLMRHRHPEPVEDSGS